MYIFSAALKAPVGLLGCEHLKRCAGRKGIRIATTDIVEIKFLGQFRQFAIFAESFNFLEQGMGFYKIEFLRKTIRLQGFLGRLLRNEAGLREKTAGH